MKTYVDTSLLVKGYVLEVDTPEVVKIITEIELPLPFTHLHEVEVPNAIRLKRFRREITVVEEQAAFRMLKADLASGRLQKSAEYDLSLLFRRAEKLSERHAATIGVRSMDLLHVAAALEIGCKQFVSLDVRQRKAAEKEGLRLIPKK